MPSLFRTSKVARVLVVGPGPIIIGQVVEFDYTGAQACKAMKEEKVTSTEEALVELEQVEEERKETGRELSEILKKLRFGA
jgi:hypothetical protein